MNRWRTFSVILLISIAILASVEIYQVLAGPAPGRNSVVTPGGQTTPCTYDNYQDSGKFIGKDCTTGDNKFIESNAYNLALDENVSNVARFWEGGTWDFSTATTGDLNVQNVTDWGIYGQTTFRCMTSGCIAWSIGNQNAVDAVFHAQNITMHDLTFDGGSNLAGGPTNSACLGITTALNVHIYHIILQHCTEQGTGCLRLTNWNSMQILSKNIFFDDLQAFKCKVTLSGAVNGHLDGSTFNGYFSSGSRALIDFSKGDIVPTATNNLGNFCFCHNNIINATWPGGIFQGFQAVSNDTIGWNVMIAGKSFLQTTDTAGGIYFEGLLVTDNYYSSGTGPLEFGYGHSITVRSNTISFDTSAGSASTAISFAVSLDPTVNQIPKNVQIFNNEIYKWGGIGIDAGFKDGIISNNEVYDVNQAAGGANSNVGLLLDTNLANAVVSGNSIISDAETGGGISRPISYNAGTNVTVTGNALTYFNCGLNFQCGITFPSTVGKNVVFRNNFGFNPYGILSTPFLNTGVVSVGLSGATATPTAGNTYQVVGVDVCITSSGGTISVTIKDAVGNTIATGVTALTNYCIPVGFTINYNTFSGATETVVGI